MASGIAIGVTIKDYTVICEEVERTANRDEHTGEILEGGNIFVEVSNIAINPAYEEMSKIIFSTIEDNKKEK